jgi:hypothetical protein
MDPDVSFIAGVMLAVFTLPAMISAFSDGRAPRVATIVMMAAGGLIVYALTHKPSGYTLQDIPLVFYEVLGKYAF